MLHFLISETQNESDGQNTEISVIDQKLKFNTTNKIPWQQIIIYQQRRPESICISAIISIQKELNGQNTDTMDCKTDTPP